MMPQKIKDLSCFCYVDDRESLYFCNKYFTYVPTLLLVGTIVRRRKYCVCMVKYDKKGYWAIVHSGVMHFMSRGSTATLI